MVDRFVDAFIEKLIVLEREAGAKVQYRCMPPLAEPLHDLVQIQGVAKDIALFAGLRGFTFVVGITKQKKNVAGHVDLSTGSNVFVEVDSDLMKFPDAVAATLCHEACHKWLQVHGIRSVIEIDNEILTDITAVFLGFGKIMLNGCRSVHVRQEAARDGTQTVTETINAGYLDRDQFAFVYRLTCAMRGISASESITGLNAEARRAVKNCDAKHEGHYDPRFHRAEEVSSRLADLESRRIGLQRTMAKLHKHGEYIKKSLCGTIDEHIDASHKAVESIRAEMSAHIENSTEPDPALRFLKAIQVDREIKSAEGAIDSASRKTDEFLKRARAIGRTVWRSSRLFPPPSSGMFAVVVCPKDGTTLRLPENSGEIVARCPKCRYSFAYNTGPRIFDDGRLSTLATAPLSWWRRLQAMVRGTG